MIVAMEHEFGAMFGEHAAKLRRVGQAPQIALRGLTGG